jgi:hypothetical protein
MKFAQAVDTGLIASIVVLSGRASAPPASAQDAAAARTALATPMRSNWDTVAGEWRQLKSRLRRLWGKLAGTSPTSPKEPTLPRTQGVAT